MGMVDMDMGGMGLIPVAWNPVPTLMLGAANRCTTGDLLTLMDLGAAVIWEDPDP